MKIASSSIAMTSQRIATEQHVRQETLRAWVGNQRPSFEGAARFERGGAGSGQAQGLGLGRLFSRPASFAPPASPPAAPSDDAKDAGELDGSDDPRLRLIAFLIEKLTGFKVGSLALDDARPTASDDPALSAAVAKQGQVAGQGQAQPRRAGWGLEYDSFESHDEFEQTSFSSQGVIRTEDGQEIHFSYDLQMTREFHSEETVSVRAGDARLKDPLVINFNGTAAQLTDARYAFDIDADGTADNVAWVTPDSGLLALDRNHNGTIDDGSELFGALTGDGFAELAAYDVDHNGWIDENDPIFNDLNVLTRDAAGDHLETLEGRDVGAINLGHAATRFALKDAANTLLGQVRATGIYAKESGGIGGIQQIDLAG